MIVQLHRGSLTDGHESVLVNASNTNCKLGTGVSGALSRSCGPRFQEQISLELTRKYGGPMKPGQVLVTHAGKHPRARWVAHVAVMDYREGFSGASFPSQGTIRTGCESLWDAVGTIVGTGPLSVAVVANDLPLSIAWGPMGCYTSIESYNGRQFQGLTPMFNQSQIADALSVAGGATVAIGNVCEPYAATVPGAYPIARNLHRRPGTQFSPGARAAPRGLCADGPRDRSHRWARRSELLHLVS